MKLRAHPNVICLAEERRLRELPARAVMFVMCITPGYGPVHAAPPAHPAEILDDKDFFDRVMAGQKAQPAASGWRGMANAIRSAIGMGKWWRPF